MKKAIIELSSFTLKDMSDQQSARNELQYLFDELVKLGYNPTTSQLVEASTGNFNSLIHQALNEERARHKRFYDEFGTDLPGGADKIKKLSNEKIAELKRNIRLISPVSETYLQQFTIDGERVEVLPEFGEGYFKEKHTISADPAILKKHEQAVSLLNELFGGTFDNEFIEFLKWFRYNPDTKQLEVNIEAYDPEYIRLDWEDQQRTIIEDLVKQRALDARIK